MSDIHTRDLLIVEHSARSDVGREREGNEDNFLEAPPLLAVADGMGGANAGEVASGTVVEILAGARDEEMPAALMGALQDANARVHEMAKEDRALSGMGTTTTAAWVSGSMLTVAHVGDSRAYRLRDGHFEQLTEDHSLVAGLVKLGKLTPAEAARHPQRSVILRAIGVESTVEIDVLEIPLEDGDLFLLCSDGLSGMIQDEVIKETLASEHSLSEMAEMLIDLANEAGGKDNITVVLFRVGHA
jgi:protein phosphatase